MKATGHHHSGDRGFARTRRSCVIFAGVGPLILLLSASRAARFDLDTDVPPGSPSGWTRGMPVITPAFPPVRTRARPATSGGPAVDTFVESRPVTKATDARLLRPVDLNQVVTIDVSGHIPWTDPGHYKPGTPGGSAAVLPIRDWERSYWTGLVPLLRLLLHPEQVSRTEVSAHLIEVGDVALPACRAALSQDVLRDVARDVITAVGSLPAPEVKFPAGASPHETCLQRLVGAELLKANPYDVVGRFGRKLELLGEQVVPVLLEFTKHPHSTLRRNAVCALGLFQHPETGERLAGLALESTDDVVRMRALAMMPRFSVSTQKIQQLARILSKEKDLVLCSRIIDTLGNMGDASAATEILQFARKNTQNGDVLPGCIAALGRLRSPGKDGEIIKFLTEISKKSRSANAWPVHKKSNSDIPDKPDPENGRTLLIRQASLIALAQLLPPDQARYSELLDMAQMVGFGDPKARVKDMQFNLWGLRASDLGTVAPFSQFDWLDVASRMGGSAVPVLRYIADTDRYGKTIRSVAFRMLPLNVQIELASRWLAPVAPAANVVPVDATLRIAAIEVLHAADAPEILESVRRVVRDAGLGGIETPQDPVDRALVLVALRILEARNALDVNAMFEALNALMPVSDVRAQLFEFIQSRVALLCKVAVAPGSEQDRRDAAIECLNEVGSRAAALVKNLGVDWKKSHLPFLLDAMNSMASKPKDTKVRDATAAGLVQYLFQPLERTLKGRGNSLESGIVPLEEVMLVMFTKIRDPRLPSLFRKLLAAEGFEYAPAAMTAALSFTGPGQVAELGPVVIPYLYHDDAVTRYCAWRLLRRMTGADHFADWATGSAVEYAKVAAAYEREIAALRK